MQGLTPHTHLKFRRSYRLLLLYRRHVYRQDFLGNMSQWDWSVSDADFCDEGGKGPTRFIYCANEQTTPPNASRLGGGGGYHMGLFSGNELEWLSSFYPPTEHYERSN